MHTTLPLSEYRSPELRLVEQFCAWERRGRGISFWNRPVHPEPAFEPFWHHDPGAPPPIDLDPPPPILVGWLDALFGFFERKPKESSDSVAPVIEPEPVFLPDDRVDPVEFQVTLPSDFDVNRETTEQLLLSLSSCRQPLAFELVGLPEEIRVHVIASPGDADLVEQQMRAHFPGVGLTRQIASLFALIFGLKDPEWSIGEYALSREFMRPLRSFRGFTPDPLTGFAGALGDLRAGELGLLQVMFAPTRKPWADSILRAVTIGEGDPFLDDELVKQAKRKIAHPLFAAVIRTVGLSRQEGRAHEINRGITGALGILAEPSVNELVCYPAPKYELVEFFFDVVYRRARRSGMLLSSEELISLVHLPSSSVQTPKLKRAVKKTKRAPSLTDGHAWILGENRHGSEATTVSLGAEQRVRHLHAIGASGTGKSTLLFNLIRQDIEHGEGVAVLDPHGDLVDKILGVIPEARIDDVVLLDPSDEEYSIGFNILSAHSDQEKNLLASDLVSVFQRLSGSWGDQMASVLNNAILAFLESSRGGTLADLRRFLLEPAFREQFLQTVRDPDVVYYWHKGFAQLAGNKSIGPVLTRLETFLSRKPIRYMVSQAENRLDFANILDTGKIFLAKLAQGIIGRENSYLLGTLLVAKLQQLAMSRQQQAEGRRKDFWCYIDEFHNFITPSMAEILSGARKYRIGLVLAHQELRQLQRDPEVASAVLSNPYSRICFRVGDEDARKLADGFSFFEARDLQNLGTGEAICRVERSDFDFNLTVPLPAEVPEDEASERRQEVIAASRRKYATPRTDVEALLYTATETEEPKQAPPTQSPPRPQAEPAAEAIKAANPPPQPAPVQPAQPEPEAAARQPTPPPEARRPGRGGAQHVYLQALVRQLAIGMNFEVEVERGILGNERSVDVLVKKGDRRFAFEMCVTTGIGYELGKVRTYRTAGFDQVVLVCPEADKLDKLQEAAARGFTPEEQRYLHFCLPEGISEVLVEFSAMCSSKDVVSHGRKTKVNYRPLSPEETRKRREMLADISTKSLRKLKGE